MTKQDYLTQFLEKQYTHEGWYDLMQKALIYASESNAQYIEELIYRYLQKETIKTQNAIRKDLQTAFNVMIKNHVI